MTVPDEMRVPLAFVDAGDLPWLELAPLLRQTLDGLPPGELLELASGDPATLIAIPGFCAGEGLLLVHSLPGDGTVAFWLGKEEKEA